METMIFDDNIFRWSNYKRDDYLPHIFCLEGSVSFILDGKPYRAFYDEALMRAFELFVFDMYDIHARQGNIALSDAPQATILMRRFIAMLQEGECLTQRQPSYYADRLCISSGYLTEVSTAVTQHTPTYWIDYFTRQLIADLLADKSLTLSDIAERMHFSSLSYFSRYCKRVLGVGPSKMRKE